MSKKFYNYPIKWYNEKTVKIAILGKKPSKFQAPFNDKSWQIWGCNVHNDFDLIPRYDLWFDIHDKPSTKINPQKLITKKNFPFDKAINLLGGKYFNNSISYMIAYSILQGAEKIALYGVKLNNDQENRTEQLKNVRELLFFAKGRGINVSSIEQNVLAEYKLYS